MNSWILAKKERESLKMTFPLSFDQNFLRLITIPNDKLKNTAAYIRRHSTPF